ncbi:hypothetical protein [Thiohalorhabdus sp.]|uniref:hypothetical protein n=1 Tax=Thiohalorhabdus sp. TaxID=3094134 RepID=UPI002FC35ABD
MVQDVTNNIGEVSEPAAKSTDTTKQARQAVKQASEPIRSLSQASQQVAEGMSTIQAVA